MRRLIADALRTAAKRLGVHGRLRSVPALQQLKQRLLWPTHPLIHVIQKANAVAIEPLRLLDVGARGGIQARWQPALPWLEVMGFDPDQEECKRLNALFRSKGDRITVYPYAVADGIGSKMLYLAGSQDCSGLLPANVQFVERLHPIHLAHLRIIETRSVETISIDEFVSAQQVAQPNFIKVDVEGAEPLVLKGAAHTLSNPELLGVESEIWLGPIKEPAAFATIDGFLRERGLHLFDIAFGRYPRKDAFTQINERDPGSFAMGQPLTGDAIYLRDPVWEFQNGVGGFRWDDSMVAKMALIYALYDLPDCGMELLRVYRETHASKLPLDDMVRVLRAASSARRC